MLTPCLSLSSPVRHREGLRLLRHPQEADHRRPSRHPGQRLGVAGEGQDDGRAAGGDAPEPGPRRRQPGPAAGHRRLGARLLPAVPEPQGRVLQRHLERHQLVYRGQQAGEVVKDFFHKKKQWAFLYIPTIPTLPPSCMISRKPDKGRRLDRTL